MKFDQKVRGWDETLIERREGKVKVVNGWVKEEGEGGKSKAEEGNGVEI